MEEGRKREIDRLLRQEYNRKYYHTHKVQVKAYQRQYMAKNAEKRSAYWQKWYAANKQRFKDYQCVRRDRLRHETAFGAFLKQQGITQCQAADALCVSQGTVSNWANGITTANEDKIRAVWPEYGGAECRN